MVRLVLDQLERNPDSRLLNSAVRYLRVQDRNEKTIASRLYNLLTKEKELFAYQQAHFLMTLRYLRNIPQKVFKLARHLATKKKIHPYVRQQAVILVSLDNLSNSDLTTFRKIFENELEPEVKRTWLQVLAQLSEQDLRELAESAAFSGDHSVQKTGRFFRVLLSNESRSREQIASLFNQITEDTLLDRLYQIEVISRSSSPGVREKLKTHLKGAMRLIHRPLLKTRVMNIINRLKTPRSDRSLFESL